MGRTACTEPQCLYKGALYLYNCGQLHSPLLYVAYRLSDLGFDSRHGLAIFIFIISYRIVLRPTQIPIHWLPVPLQSVVKRSKLEADT